MTFKKQKSKMTAKFRKGLGLKDYKLSSKLTNYNCFGKITFTEISELLSKEFGEAEYFEGCSCCGDSSHSWKGHKNMILVHQYRQFKLE